MDIYQYIDSETSEGQDILNLFFIAFNKYTGKADKNQAFTPDHITEFMCRITGVNKNKIVLDSCCGSGSFLVQAMVKELADCRLDKTADEYKQQAEKIKKEHIFGIEIEEKAYGLSTTNMLIHGDGNSNIEFGNCFNKKEFIKKAEPDIFLLNPPYNAKPLHIPAKYKKGWKKDAKKDPTKGFCFVQYLSDIVKEINDEKEKNGEDRRLVKLAVLLPLSCAIGGKSSEINSVKKAMLKENTLEAVFTLPQEVFYPGASVNVCCMLFTLGQPHKNADGDSHSTFFGYCKEDGFVKKKNLGRIEKFDEQGNSFWKEIESSWIRLFNNKETKDGSSAVKIVDSKDEWLCEAYMKTDYRNLKISDFQKSFNNYLAYLIKDGQAHKMLSILDIDNRKNRKIPNLNVDNWVDFKVKNLFEVIGSTTTKLEDLEEKFSNEKRYNYVTTSAQNNGVDDKFSIATEKGNVIVVESACMGYSTYQATDFTASDHVELLRPYFDLSFNIAIFLVTIINGENFKFSYGRKCNQGKIKSMILKLPIQHDNSGNPLVDMHNKYHEDGYIPDWKFMEDYINSLPYSD